MAEIDVNSIFRNRKRLGAVSTTTQQPSEQDKVEQSRVLAEQLGFQPQEYVDLAKESESEDETVTSGAVADPEETKQIGEVLSKLVKAPPSKDDNTVYGNAEVVPSTVKGVPPLVKAPPVLNKKSKTSGNKPVVDDDDSDAQMRKMFDEAFTKNRKPAVTNLTDAESQTAKYVQTRIGSFPYTEDSLDAAPEQPGFQRLDNVSGILPYNNTTFKGRIYIKDMTIRESAALAKALASQSYALLFDALGKVVNVPYRRLTVADHIQIMYYVLITSYPAQPLEDLRWTSALYGVETVKSTAYKFKITEKVFDMDPETWSEYEDLGFTLPRVYDLEHFQMLAEKDQDEDYYLLGLAQYLDPEHPKIRPYVKQAAKDKSVAPRLQGRLDYIGEQPTMYRVKLDKFIELTKDFGVSEELALKADVKDVTLGQAVAYLQNIAEAERSDAQKAELARLESLLPAEKLDEYLARKDELTNNNNRSEDEEAELQKLLQEDPWMAKFTPVEEDRPFTRDTWRFFPFL